MTELGVVFRPQLPPERLRAVAAAADEAGLDELWLWEDCFSESGIAAATAALAWTTRLRVGIGILPMPLRNVALTAMELATAQRIFPGRLRVGFGSGVQSWMGQAGAKVDSPLTLMSEYVPAMRSLLQGDEVTSSGRYVNLDRVRLDWPPTEHVPILIGAEGPKTLQSSGEIADGTILVGGTTPDGVRNARRLIDEGRELGGRTDKHHIIVYLIAATGAGADERLAEQYRQWSVDPSEDVGVAGGAAELAAAVRRWADAGADTVVFQPAADDPDLEGFIELVAREVRPLI